MVIVLVVFGDRTISPGMLFFALGDPKKWDPKKLLARVHTLTVILVNLVATLKAQ
jgi:hypothetical protein